MYIVILIESLSTSVSTAYLIGLKWSSLKECNFRAGEVVRSEIEILGNLSHVHANSSVVDDGLHVPLFHHVR